MDALVDGLLEELNCAFFSAEIFQLKIPDADR